MVTKIPLTPLIPLKPLPGAKERKPLIAPPTKREKEESKLEKYMEERRRAGEEAVKDVKLSEFSKRVHERAGEVAEKFRQTELVFDEIPSRLPFPTAPYVPPSIQAKLQTLRLGRYAEESLARITETLGAVPTGVEVMLKEPRVLKEAIPIAAYEATVGLAEQAHKEPVQTLSDIAMFTLLTGGAARGIRAIGEKVPYRIVVRPPKDVLVELGEVYVPKEPTPPPPTKALVPRETLPTEERVAFFAEPPKEGLTRVYARPRRGDISTIREEFVVSDVEPVSTRYGSFLKMRVEEPLTDVSKVSDVKPSVLERVKQRLPHIERKLDIEAVELRLQRREPVPELPQWTYDVDVTPPPTGGVRMGRRGMRMDVYGGEIEQAPIRREIARGLEPPLLVRGIDPFDLPPIKPKTVETMESVTTGATMMFKPTPRVKVKVRPEPKVKVKPLIEPTLREPPEASLQVIAQLEKQEARARRKVKVKEMPQIEPMLIHMELPRIAPKKAPAPMPIPTPAKRAKTEEDLIHEPSVEDRLVHDITVDVTLPSAAPKVKRRRKPTPLPRAVPVTKTAPEPAIPKPPVDIAVTFEEPPIAFPPVKKKAKRKKKKDVYRKEDYESIYREWEHPTLKPEEVLKL
jgi:hypothetical protein